MPQRQRLSLYIPGSPPGALPESTYTPSSDRRRSLISLPDSLNFVHLKPSKKKLQKSWWPGAKSPTTRGCADYTTTTAPHDLSTLIMLAGEQMGALGDPRRKTTTTSSFPRRPALSQRDDPELRRELEMTLPKSATAATRPGSSGGSGIQRKPLPAGAAVPRCAASVPAPSRAPPPPPIPELSAVNYHSEDAALASPPSPIASISTMRRRAKTPVHHIGQLEAAQRRRDNKGSFHTGNMDGINRMSSVSTIAREYRELAVYPDTDIPEVPELDPSYLRGQGVVEQPATQDDDIRDSHLLGAAYHNHRRTPSSTSDDGTLLGSEADVSCPSLTHSNSPPAEMSDYDDEDDEVKKSPAPASLRFQLGLELLTKELSTALAEGRRQQRDDGGTSAAGLQVWVMIEAYERLRERLDKKPTAENEQAREAIDAWIRALYAIHGDIVSEGAADESEYEDD